MNNSTVQPFSGRKFLKLPITIARAHIAVRRRRVALTWHKVFSVCGMDSMSAPEVILTPQVEIMQVKSLRITTLNSRSGMGRSTSILEK